MYRLTGFAHILLILAALLFLAVSVTGCEDGERVLSDHPETVPARIALLMSPNLLADDITSARLIITAPDFEMMELDLSIDPQNNRATGSFEMPPGDARLIRAEA